MENNITFKRKQDIDVLGRTWTVFFLPPDEFRDIIGLAHECDGLTDPTVRKIFVLCKDYDFIDPMTYTKEVARHEVIHAFLYESGLSSSWEHDPFGHDETFVDWVAIQMPKIIKACRKLGCM